MWECCGQLPIHFVHKIYYFVVFSRLFSSGQICHVESILDSHIVNPEKEIVSVTRKVETTSNIWRVESLECPQFVTILTIACPLVIARLTIACPLVIARLTIACPLVIARLTIACPLVIARLTIACPLVIARLTIACPLVIARLTIACPLVIARFTIACPLVIARFIGKAVTSLFFVGWFKPLV